MAVKKIIMSGEIGWDISPRNIREQLDVAAGADLDVHLASSGGFVGDGIEIFNLIRDYKRTYPAAQLALTIKGDAASMASYIAVNPAWDLVAAEDNAIFMIHNAWGVTVGDYRDMVKMGEILDGVTGILGKAYSAKTGKSEKSIRTLMDDETWYFGDEMKDAGFVDEIIKTDSEKDKTAALASGKIRFSALSKKMSEAAAHTDIEKIAALIPKPSTQPAPQTRDNNSGDPGKNNQEDSMNLAEFLAQNPAAKIEHDAALQAADRAGYERGKADVKAIAAKAAVYANSKDYPGVVRSLAIDVMQMNKPIEALDALVANTDMMAELLKSEKAKAETAALGATPGQQEGLSPDGQMNTALDVQAQIKRDRIALGLEVQ